MTLEKLLDGTRNTWANFRVETLRVDNGITFGPDTTINPDDIAPGDVGDVLITGANGVEWSDIPGGPVPASGIVAGTDGQIIRTVGGVTTWQDEILNSNLPTNVVVDGSLTASSLSGSLSESDISPGANGQVLSTVGGVSDWVDNTDILPSGALNNVLVHDGSSYVSQAEIDPSNIPDLSITTGKIVAGSITLAKMANDSVGTAQLVDSSVNAQRLASNSVSTIKVQKNAITPAKIEEGNNGDVLTTNGTTVEWAAPSGSGNQISFIKAPLNTLSANGNFDFDATFEFNQIGLTKGSNPDIINGFPTGIYRIEVTGSARDLTNQNAAISIENNGDDLTTVEMENLNDLDECTFPFYASSVVEKPGDITIAVNRSGTIVFAGVNLTITKYA